MAVTTQNSTEYESLYGTTLATLNPTELRGQLYADYFVHDQSGAGDAASFVYTVKLPPGRVRLHGKLSNLYVNWTTASATMDVGWLAYTGLDGTAVAASATGIDSNIDVDAVGARTLGTALTATGYTKLFESRDGVTITCRSDTAIVASDDLAGTIVYTMA